MKSMHAVAADVGKQLYLRITDTGCCEWAGATGAVWGEGMEGKDGGGFGGVSGGSGGRGLQ